MLQKAMRPRIALIGDYDPKVAAHRAIPLALERAGGVQFDWKHTSTLGPLDGYHGVWCVPASPYASEAAAIAAIRWARENHVPFLGTCGGSSTPFSNLRETSWAWPAPNTPKRPPAPSVS